MAAIQNNVELRLAIHARLLLYVAAMLAWAGCKLPHHWIVAVTNNSWRMRTGAGRWRSIRIDNRGRIIP